MQFDRMRIAVRERSYLELLDLAMVVIRGHAGAWLALSLLGILPFAIFNYWLLGLTELADLEYDIEAFPAGYVALYLLLVAWEMPLASSLVTLFFGQLMFHDQPDWGRLRSDFFNSLFQLTLIQVFCRAAMILFTVTILVLYVVWPYMNEVILLERNPIFAGKSHHISTFKRCTRLHEFSLGELFGRWLASLAFGGCWVVALWATLRWARQIFTDQLELDQYSFTVLFPAALWFVVAYFNVVRYLSYLDLRIKTEGWEVELLLRAEAAKLARQAAP
ncbi:MAG: hypothetical protein SGJ19_23380 [Planctomycetia bacterium]|nr:hypothetical protein [Planctomycetia bacterium]